MSKNDDNIFGFTMARAIDVGMGSLYGLSAGGSKTPVAITNVACLGSLGTYEQFSKNSTCKDDDNFINSNIIGESDTAFVPPEAERLALSYCISFRRPKHLIANGGALTTLDTVRRAFETDTYTLELARRYFWNIVNGRTLWRNRVDGDIRTVIRSNNFEIEGVRWPVTITSKEGDISHYHSGYESELSAYAENEKGEKITLGVDFFLKIFNTISDALRGKSSLVIFGIETSVPTMEGFPVYPSQEFIDGGKTRVLYSIEKDGIRQAAMHSQKIGNAIRTIDDWYGAEGETVPVNSVEFFGFNKESNTARRHISDKGTDEQTLCIYHIIGKKRASELNKVLKGELEESLKDKKDILYLLGIMCRGGILTTSLSKSKKEEE